MERKEEEPSARIKGMGGGGIRVIENETPFKRKESEEESMGGGVKG